MKHAFLIIAHNEYPVLEVLLSMLDDERNDIYLHIDKRATELFQQIKKVKMQKAGFYLIENPIKVYWGDISQVQVEYLLFETALSHGPYAYYHLLSGTDLPIKSQDYIHAFFQQNAGKEFVGFWQDAAHQRDLERKVFRYYFFTKRLKDKEHLLHGITALIRNLILAVQKISHYRRKQTFEFKKGGNWISITENAVKYLLQYKEIVLNRIYTTNEVAPQYGGVERVTANIANALTTFYNVNCYSAYKYNIDKSFIKQQFVNTIKINSYHNLNNLIQFIEQNKIDVIINQGEHKLTKSLRLALNQSQNKKCKLMFALHVSPATEINFITLDNPKKELKEGKNIRKNISKFLSFPYQKIRKIIKLPILYRESYHFADKVILLSSHFKKPFLEYSHLKDDSKIRIIHNALSFHSFYDLANYNHKKKEVLIVSRLEEEPKRISLALKIWKEIETDHTLSEWKLKIVGHGKMESWYKSLVIHYGLQRVFFEGTKNPEPYYNEASIFMMTSSFEGWGLTLTEAQQYGCVPLAFHSFASLTDIITDKVNGFAIPNDDISLYIKQMKLLMTDEKLRKSMSANAIESSKQFSIEIIIKKWMEVINE